MFLTEEQDPGQTCLSTLSRLQNASEDSRQCRCRPAATPRRILFDWSTAARGPWHEARVGSLTPQILRSGWGHLGHPPIQWQIGRAFVSLSVTLNQQGGGGGGRESTGLLGGGVPHPGQVPRGLPTSACLLQAADSVPHVGISKDLRVLAVFRRCGRLVALSCIHVFGPQG